MKAEQIIVVLLILGLIAMGALIVIKPTNINLTGKITGGVGSETQEKSIQVSGESTINVDADQAEIILGVETQEKTALDSQQKNAEEMEKIMNALRANGIKKEDIKTYQYSVYPIRNYNSEKPNFEEIIAYRTSNIVIIKTKDLANAGKVIDAAASAGANVFQGISFGLTDEKQTEYRTKVLKEASKNARDKADSIANGLGIKIQSVLRASESSYYQPVYRNYDMVAAGASEKSYSATTEVSPGMIQVSATVSVSYEFV